MGWEWLFLLVESLIVPLMVLDEQQQQEEVRDEVAVESGDKSVCSI